MKKWIAIKDKIPSKDGRYLVWGDGWDWVGPAICCFKIEDDEYLWYQEDSGNDVVFEPIDTEYGNTLPTHWMELPQPPK